MKKVWVNYVVDILLLVCFFVVGITGILKFPGWFGFGRGGLVSVLHDWSGIVMVGLVLVHLVLHFRWLLVMTKQLFGKKE